MKADGENGEGDGEGGQRIKHRKKTGRNWHFGPHPGGLGSRDSEGAVMFVCKL